MVSCAMKHEGACGTTNRLCKSKQHDKGGVNGKAVDMNKQHAMRTKEN